MFCIDLNITCLSLCSAGWLMDHDLGIRKCKPFPLCAAGKKKCAHAGCHTNAGSGNITFYILHRVIDCHSCCNTSARGIDIEMNILTRIFALQEKELCDDKAGSHIVYFLTQENDSLL